MRSIADGETFAMASGEQVALADRSTLRYVRVTNDSRCKPGRQCVWAGDAEVVFEWTADAAGAPESFSLHTGRGDRSRDLGGRRLTLVSLADGAEPEAQLKLAALPCDDVGRDLSRTRLPRRNLMAPAALPPARPGRPPACHHRF